MEMQYVQNLVAVLVEKQALVRRRQIKEEITSR
jgi:hypothetical protein